MSVKLSNFFIVVASVMAPLSIAEIIYVNFVGLDTCNRMTPEWHHHYRLAEYCQYKSRPRDDIPKINLSLDPKTQTRKGELDPRLNASTYANVPLNKPHVMILGDSFVQGDEVPISNHFGSLLRQKIGTSNYVSWHGYSSWSPLLEYKYYKWLVANNPRLSADTLIFVVFGNDLLPRQVDYSDQYYWYNSSPRDNVDYLLARESYFTDVTISDPQDYYFGKGIVTMVQSLGESIYGAFKAKVYVDFATSSSTAEFNSLQALTERKQAVAQLIRQWPNVRDSSAYLKSANMLFSPINQWHPAFINSAQLSIDAMRQIAADATKNGVKNVLFVYLPYGWEVSSCENYPGYFAYYPRQTFIPNSGVRSFLSSRLGSVDSNNYVSSMPALRFIDSTEFLRSRSPAPNRLGCADGRQVNYLYYGFDGHLNTNGHRSFYLFLSQSIAQLEPISD